MPAKRSRRTSGRAALVAVADGCGAPVGVSAMLADTARAVGGVRALLGWSMTAPIDVHDREAFTDVRTVMSGYALRAPVRDGLVRYLPVRLGSVPRLLAGALRPDVLVAALRPGDRGLVFGSEVGWMRAAVDAGATVLAEVNHGLPEASDGVPIPAGTGRGGDGDRPPAAPVHDQPARRRRARHCRPCCRARARRGGAAVRAGDGRRRHPPRHRGAGAVDSGLVGDAVLDLDRRGLVVGRPRGARTSRERNPSTSGPTGVRCSNRSR